MSRGRAGTALRHSQGSGLWQKKSLQKELLMSIATCTPLPREKKHFTGLGSIINEGLRLSFPHPHPSFTFVFPPVLPLGTSGAFCAHPSPVPVLCVQVRLWCPGFAQPHWWEVKFHFWVVFPAPEQWELLGGWSIQGITAQHHWANSCKFFPFLSLTRLYTALH